jgi:hypothetical protein
MAASRPNGHPGRPSRRRLLLAQDQVALAFFDLIDDEQFGWCRANVSALMPAPDRFDDEITGSIYLALAGLRIGDFERSR